VLFWPDLRDPRASTNEVQTLPLTPNLSAVRA
jgi:hypothetical protein